MKVWSFVAQLARIVLEYAELRSLPEQTIVEQVDKLWRIK